MTPTTLQLRTSPTQPRPTLPTRSPSTSTTRPQTLQPPFPPTQPRPTLPTRSPSTPTTRRQTLRPRIPPTQPRPTLPTRSPSTPTTRRQTLRPRIPPTQPRPTLPTRSPSTPTTTIPPPTFEFDFSHKNNPIFLIQSERQRLKDFIKMSIKSVDCGSSICNLEYHQKDVVNV